VLPSDNFFNSEMSFEVHFFPWFLGSFIAWWFLVCYYYAQRRRYVIGRYLGTASLSATTNLDRNYKTIKLSKTAA
jgi:hypothetical protein